MSYTFKLQLWKSGSGKIDQNSKSGKVKVALQSEWANLKTLSQIKSLKISLSPLSQVVLEDIDWIFAK